MSSLFPVLTETGRRWWLLAAVVLGVLGIALSVMRRDWTAAVAIAAGLAVLVGVWWWGRGAGEGEE